MIDLDELKQNWAELDKKLDENLRLNRRLLIAPNLNGARSAIQRTTLFLSLQLAIWFAIVVALGSFTYEHAGTLVLALSGAAADFYCVSMIIFTIRQLAAAQQIDYSQPITIIQQKLEVLRVLRIGATKWGVLAGITVWAPFAIVVLKAFFGVELSSVAWLSVNVLFGLALIPLAIWLSKTFGDRMTSSPFIQRLMRDIAGHNLTAAQAFLASLSQFAQENK